MEEKGREETRREEKRREEKRRDEKRREENRRDEKRREEKRRFYMTTTTSVQHCNIAPGHNIFWLLIVLFPIISSINLPPCILFFYHSFLSYHSAPTRKSHFGSYSTNLKVHRVGLDKKCLSSLT